MGDFWTSLENSGVNLASQIISPLQGGITQGIANLVNKGRTDVTAISNTIAGTTSPNDPTKSQPATPPTTTLSTALTQSNLGLWIVAGLIVILLFLRRK